MWHAQAGRKGALVPLVPDVAAGEHIIVTHTREEAVALLCARLRATDSVIQLLQHRNSLELTPEVFGGCEYCLLQDCGDPAA